MPSIINATTTNGVVTSGDNSGSLQLATNNGTTAVTIDTSQRVGIGTTSPAVNLTVNGATNPQIAVTSPAGTGAFLTIAAGGTTINSTSFDLLQDSSGLAYVYNRSNAALVFATNNTEVMRVTSGLNVGIGTTTPSTKLQVDGTVTSNGLGISASGGSASITNQASGDARPLFISNSSASGLPNGSLYINNTNDANNVGYSLIQCVAGSTGRFVVYGNGQVNATGAYTNVSDVRIKKDIADATPKLDKLMQVRVVNYTRTDHPDNIKEIGVIAQELEDIFPTLISEVEEKDKDGNVTCPDRKLVKYSVFVPILIKAIQELKAELDATKAEVAALKGAA